MVKKYRMTKKAVIRRVGYKKRQGTGKHYPVVYRLPVGMPEKYTCKLKYNGLFTLNAPVGTPAIQAFRLNGIQDYDLTGVGHQPTPFDQLAAFYKKYFVRSAKVIISPLRQVGDSAVNGFVCFGASIQPVSGITAGLTWDDLMQSEKTTQRIRQYMTTGADSSPAGMTGPVKIYYSAKRYYGKGYDDEDYKSLVTTVPAKGPILDVWAIQPHGSDPSAINLNVWTEFIVSFSDPQTIGIS